MKTRAVYAIAAAIALAVVFAFAGHLALPPEGVTGLSALGMMIGNIDEIKTSIADLKTAVLGRVDALEQKNKAIEQTLLKVQRESLDGGGDIKGETPPHERKLISDGVRLLLAGKQEKANELFIEAKAMKVGSEGDGGYFVVPEFSRDMTKVMAEISPMSRLAREITLTSGIEFEEIVDKDQAEAQWVAEAGARNDTNNPQVGKFRVACEEIYAQPKASQTLLDGTNFDVMGWLGQKVGDAFGIKESAAFHTGDGIGKPRGFTSYPTAETGDATRPWGTLETVKTGQDSDFPAGNPSDKLVDLVTALKPQYRAGAVWLMSRQVVGKVSKFRDGENRLIWRDSLQAGVPPTLLGYPVEYSEDMPVLGVGSLSLAFGNFKRGYTIVRRLGVRFLVDPYTDKPNVRLYAYSRVGGGVNNFEAIKLLKFAV